MNIRPSRDAECLDDIAEPLDGKEWGADILDVIEDAKARLAELVRWQRENESEV